jgi:PST family polysaccharide transporter/lipopolysaccharide exporter
MGTASLVYLRADVLALGWARSSTEVGRYSAAMQVYQGAWIAGSVIAVVSLPRLVRAAATNSDTQLWDAARRLNVGMLALGGSLGVVMLVVAPSALPFVLGREFRTSVPLLRILACTLPLVYVDFALGNTLIAMHRERVTMFNSLALAVLAVALFAPAAATEGAAGVAVVVVGLTVVSTAVQGSAVLMRVGQRA